MPENAHPRFFAGAFFELRAHNRADPAESRLAGFGVRARSHELSLFLACALGHDDDRELLSQALALADLFTTAFVGERNLRNRNDVFAACDAVVERDPAGVASHDVENRHAVVTFYRCLKPVTR